MIYVVRHGQTDMNLEGRLQGRLGLPLNGNGLKQAEDIRRQLENIKFDFVFTSPQERAVKTAEIISGLKASIDSRLDVFDLGEADGLLRSETKIVSGIPDPSYYKGIENPKEFVKRIFSFMSELEQSIDYEANILICGHRCTTGCIGAYFEGVPENLDILKYSSNTGKYKSYQFRKVKKSSPTSQKL